MIGKKLSHYKIIEKIGEGGMAVVYRAEDVKLKRTVALKFISSQALGSPKEKTRFVREAQAVASLDHPNICTLYEIDEAEGQTFLAMSFIKGLSLEKKILTSPLKLEEALDIAIQVAEGLEEAHEKGIVHRDIKSSNIMITEKGQAKIMDFGIAKLAERTKITETATIMGTVAYMSPEQAFGEAVDQRTDLWSLGIVLYEMVTGQLPFKGEYPQVVLNSILDKKPEPITSLRSGIPLQFEAIVNRCLEKSASERYQTAADLKADLKRLKRDLETGQVTSTLPTAARRARKSALKVALPLGALAAALFFLLFLPSTRDIVSKWLSFKIPQEKHLAVFPFTLIGGSEADQAFCDGVAEILRQKLGQLGQFQKSMWVVPLSHIQSWQIRSPGEARQVLGVNLALRGSMKRIGDTVSLTLSLVEPRNLRQLGFLEKTDHIGNLFALEKEIIAKTAEILGIKLKPQTNQLLDADSATIPGAYESYLKGLGHLLSPEKDSYLDSAINSFAQAIEQDSSYALAYNGMAEAYLKKYETSKEPEFAEKAQTFCRNAIEMNDRFAPFHLTLGAIYKGIGRYEDAIEEFKEALELEPANYDAKIYLAIAYEESGDFENAEKAYQEAVRLRPNYWSAQGNLGFFYFFQGRYEQAKDSFLKAAELSPGNILSLNNLGAAYFKLGQNDPAAAMFEKSISIKLNADACSNLGYLYYFQGRYADAMNMSEEAIKLGRNEYLIWGNLADAYHYTPGYSKKASEAYQTAAQLAEKQLFANPNDAEARSSLAVYQAKLGNHEKALSAISEALQLKPNELSILIKSIQVYEIANQRAQALQTLQKYIALNGPLKEVLKDPYLSRLRTEPGFRKLVGDAASAQDERGKK